MSGVLDVFYKGIGHNPVEAGLIPTIIGGDWSSFGAGKMLSGGLRLQLGKFEKTINFLNLWMGDRRSTGPLGEQDHILFTTRFPLDSGDSDPS